ncbi:uncharacterized protein TNCV_159381 [Trichonephila clavipes]|uniref:Uncharacterized protein n=1 Tax=Trichonephila clavipes TaxID=2585209 RepID=A0A8X6UUG4_TRICX|nr:uncharacterized protein TNCV_159381 [Trichonephila clavipes]
MACDSEDCEFQLLNDDEIATSVQEESDPIDDETEEDEGNNESSKGRSNADAFSALEVVRTTECCPTQLLLLKRIRDLAAKKRSVRFHILHRWHLVFGYPNNRVSERCTVQIDSFKRRSTMYVIVIRGSVTKLSNALNIAIGFKKKNLQPQKRKNAYSHIHQKQDRSWSIGHLRSKTECAVPLENFSNCDSHT